MTEPIASRKADHLALCSTDEVRFQNQSTLLECVRLIHDALPEVSAAEIDTEVTLFGKTLRAPFLIAAMTGGTEEAGTINHELAAIAEARGYAFGLGSQRAMQKRTETAGSYRVREAAKTTVVLGNLGVIQASELSTEVIAKLANDVGADALCVHLNPAMELVQTEGDRDFRGGLETLERLARELPIPVIAKETGCGLSRGVGQRLFAAGVRHVDVSGAGGTSWVGVETKRAASIGDDAASALGAVLWDWGVPTAASVGLVAPLGFETVFATGGVGSGLDAARAIALGATAAGIARPVLMAFRAGGRAAVDRFFDQVERELRAVMLLTGSKDLAALRRAPRIVTGDLAAWLA